MFFSIRNIVFAFLSFLISFGAFATNKEAGDKSEQHDYQTKLVNLHNRLTSGHTIFQLGGFLANANIGQHINIQGLVGNTYSPEDHVSGNVFLGIGYFLEPILVSSTSISYGLNWFFLPKTNYRGTVTEENLFTNLRYNYGIINYPLYVVAKTNVALEKITKHTLTFDIGIGPNFINTTGYRESAININSVPNTPFPNKTHAKFSATFGAGVQLDNKVFPKLPLECGYRFFYLGEGSFGLNSNQLNPFKTGSVFANAILCSITV